MGLADIFRWFRPAPKGPKPILYHLTQRPTVDEGLVERLRIELRGLKNNPGRAAELERMIAAFTEELNRRHFSLQKALEAEQRPVVPVKPVRVEVSANQTTGTGTITVKSPWSAFDTMGGQPVVPSLLDQLQATGFVGPGSLMNAYQGRSALDELTYRGLTAAIDHGLGMSPAGRAISALPEVLEVFKKLAPRILPAEGRLVVREELLRNTAKLGRLKEALEQVPGIQRVEARASTGRIAIEFSPEVLTVEELLTMLNVSPLGSGEAIGARLLGLVQELGEEKVRSLVADVVRARLLGFLGQHLGPQRVDSAVRALEIGQQVRNLVAP